VFASSRFFSARDLIYPVIGVVLAWRIFGHEMLPLLFPLASGIPLIGPLVRNPAASSSAGRSRAGNHVFG
jgi:uncharacterized membrane protein